METREILVKVEGMTCNNCAAGISKSLNKAGFKNADANFLEGEVSFTLVEGKTPEEAFENIESLGYKVKEANVAEKTGLSLIEKKFVFTLFFTVPLFLHMFTPHDFFLNHPLVQLGLCLPVYILGFAHFGKSAWGSIKAGMANMDVLIFIGSSAAFFYSLIGTFLNYGTPEMHRFMFFETTATIITLVLLGNVLEHRSVKQTTKSIGELSKMEATLARIVMRVGTREKIYEADAATVREGDELQVNEGDYFPVDGIVISGTARVSEAAVTGESEAVKKETGSEVYSGTTLISGNLRIRASHAAKDSTLQKIIDLVKKARRDHPQIQVLGDKVSAIFVPVVLVISALTFLGGHFLFDLSVGNALMNAVAVLVISCPCAMGLATPTAVVAGVGRAAKNGILIKGGSTLERFAQANTVIFDKTGTLTSGKFSIKEIENTIHQRAAALALALESHSSHPIAKAFSAHFSQTEPEKLDQIEEIKGKGIRGWSSENEEVFIGKSENPESDIALKINGEVVSSWKITDSILPGAKEMIADFEKNGLRTVLLSGDRKSKVIATAEELGIKDVYYEMSPQQKLDYIEQEAIEHTLAMVGDGINDGPALSRAQVGISPGGASALAIDSARVVIMNRNEMESLIMAYKISKHTYLTIKQNLFWAFFYNVVAIPIAAFGLLNPMIAALAMAFSDVVVIGNSLRLKIKKLR